MKYLRNTVFLMQPTRPSGLFADDIKKLTELIINSMGVPSELIKPHAHSTLKELYELTSSPCTPAAKCDHKGWRWKGPPEFEIDAAIQIAAHGRNFTTPPKLRHTS